MRRMLRTKKIFEERGMALVLTLMAVSFLVAITVQLTSSVNLQMQGAGNLRDSVQLDAMNRSGLSLIRAALAADFKKNKHDTEFDSWGDLGRKDAPAIFGSGRLNINVTDLSGLLQINALVPEEKDPKKSGELQNKQIAIWKRFLTSGRFAIDDDKKAEELIDAIIDWIDKDDNERDNGAESGYYLSLSPSYKPRNGPIPYKEELLLIRGMTKDIFYGNEEYSPLAPHLTVAGRDGKVNINSAPVEVLMLLDENMSEEMANDLVQFRQEEDNETALANPLWYKQVNGGLVLNEDLVEIKSQYFEVSVVANHNELVRSGKGIIERDRDKGSQKLLYWEVR